MTEQHVRFETDDGLRLEGLLHAGNNGRGVVITHPHPLYGGDMRNNVVTTVQHIFQETGCSTLRFNFRGVGTSGGSYDDGDGEQTDLKAALRALWETGVSAVDLAGYSFGAWVIARAASEAKITCRHVIMIAPPVGMLPFPPELKLPSLALVIAGSRDLFAPSEEIAIQAPLWNPTARLVVINGADHFFFGFEKSLGDALKVNSLNPE